MLLRQLIPEIHLREPIELDKLTPWNKKILKDNLC